MSLSAQEFKAFRHPTLHHHDDGEICPTCEQTIPNDRLEQVKARQARHQQEVESRYALRVKAEHEQLVAQLQRQSEEALAKVRQEEAAARTEERRLAAAEADASIETVRAQANELKRQLEASDAAAVEKVAAARAEERRAAAAEADAKNTAATAAVEAERAQAAELKKQLEASNASTVEKVDAARDAARKEADAALQPQLAAAQSATQQAQEQARVLSEREEAARAQVVQLAKERQQAVTAKAASDQQVQALRGAHEKAIRDSVQETRDAMEKSHRDSVNAEQAKHFEEKQKFQNTVDDLKRQLENKTALELGEGAEIDLFEALKAAFPDDDITRIKRGLPGADIRHVARLNGKDCGLILYDSKNHKSWRSDFVSKLRDDQIADKADHAILSTYAFPQGTRQLHVQDGVILANPARVVAIAKLVRQQVIHAHRLNLSNDDRGQKSLELYSFITSERHRVLMTKLQTTADNLQQLDIAEQAAHNKTWQKRGQLIGGAAKAQADLMFEVERIVGTSEAVTGDGLAETSADTAGTGA